jgi:hypothetical protein
MRAELTAVGDVLVMDADRFRMQPRADLFV